MRKLADSVNKKLKLKRVIFTVSTGRCGTAYLDLVMNFFPGSVSLHEPTPYFHSYMRSAQTDSNIARDFLIDKKLPVISEFPCSIYFESSHLFCKGFLEPCLDLGVYPDIIHLHREHRKVATSLFKMGTIPGKSEKALQFYLCPADSGVSLANKGEGFNDYQLCYWYCIEMEKRANKYRSMYEDLDANFVSISLEELVTLRGFIRMKSELKLPEMRLFDWLRYFKYKAVKANQSFETKKDVKIPGNLDELEQEVRDNML